MGCHFLLQCMKVKSQSEIVQSCPTLRNPMDCSLPGSSADGIFQARVLEWGAIASSTPRSVRHRHKKDPGGHQRAPQTELTASGTQLATWHERSKHDGRLLCGCGLLRALVSWHVRNCMFHLWMRMFDMWNRLFNLLLTCCPSTHRHLSPRKAGGSLSCSQCLHPQDPASCLAYRRRSIMNK